MKKIITIITLLLVLASSVFAGDAGRKYTKVTINGESAKVYTDDKVETEFEEMKKTIFVYNGKSYYKYEYESEPITKGEYDYYSKKGTWTKVVFKDRVEFFWCTKNFGPVGMKYTFTSEFYESALANTIIETFDNLAKSIDNVANQF
ncbi:MAG: hypothetical protein J6S85_09975 [Methanobrevibacter sp.]|nr:hypothetical protein [Methanobrevibacter sp.]